MTMRTISCPCGESVVVDVQGLAVGQIQEKSGYTALLTYHGEIIYLCPACMEKALAAAKELFAVVRTWDVYLPSFKRRVAP